MTPRDSYKSIDYFEQQLARSARRREKHLAYLANPDEQEQARQASLNIIYETQLRKSLTLYSVGHELDTVVAEFNAAWPLLLEVLTFSHTTSLDKHKRFMMETHLKHEILPLMVLCEPPKSTIDSILNFTKTPLNWEVDEKKDIEIDAQFDPFTYQLATFLGYKADKVHTDLIWGPLTEKLYACFGASEPERPALLKAYVDNWVKISTKEGIYLKNEHSMATNQEFRGYWCFMAAAVAKVLDIPDEELKGHPHYPYDLRHYHH